MSTETLVEKLGKQIERRNFLAKAGTVAVGSLLALIGLSQSVAATVSYRCCNLCYSPGACSNCNCTWCWQCCDTNFFPPRKVNCCECYNSITCDGSCVNATCSYAIDLGTNCPYVRSK